MHEQQNGMHYTSLAEADRIDSGFVAHTNHVCSHTRSISAIIKSNITRLCRFAMYHLRTYACSFVALWPAIAIAIAHSVNDKTFEYLISICLCCYAAGGGAGAVSYFYFICLLLFIFVCVNLCNRNLVQQRRPPQHLLVVWCCVAHACFIT